MKDLKEPNKTKNNNNLIRMYNINEHYKILEKVGRGTYGTVYKAKGLKDNKFYAIKKLENNDSKLQQQGFPITALRQITLLKQIDHPNIIKLKEIILSKPNKRNLFRGSTFLVFQYMDHDFAGLFKTKHKFAVPQIKCIIKQLLEGVHYLHRNKILHRDIKSANILLNDQGDVKLADFGLGRKIKMESIFTYKVVTLWYRAPELLWGCKTYTDRIDVWSVGCVLCQFFTGEVLFRKQTETAQIQRIYEICGDFQVNQIKLKEEDCKNYQYINQMKPKKAYKNELKSYLLGKYPTMSQITIDFIEGLLCLDPSKRLSCDEALRHPFFNEKPTACLKTQIQKQQFECHEMFKDRSIKIQRITKRQEENETKSYKNSHNNNHSNRPQKFYKEYRPYHNKNQKKQKNINSSSSPFKNSSSNMSSGYSSERDHHRRSSREYNSKKNYKEDRRGRDYQDNRKERLYRNDYQDKKYKYEQKKPFKNQRQKKEYVTDKYDKYDDKYRNKDDKRKEQRKDQRLDRKDVKRQDSRLEKRSEDYYQSNDNKYKYERNDKYDKYQKEKYDSKADYYKDSRNHGGDKDRNHLINKEKDYKRRQQVNFKHDLKEKDIVYDKYQYRQKYKNDFKGESRGDYKPDYKKLVSQKKGDKFIYTRNQRESSSSKSSYSSRNNNRKERQHRKYGYERKGNYKKQHQSSPQHYH